jgi:putative nucleotidyltransferase with HDIG domain
VLATFAVVVLPALAVSLMDTAGRPWLLLSSVLLAMAFSVAAATVGSALWARRQNSRDLVFGDLMLWGLLRRVRAERRLAEAWRLLGGSATGTDGSDRSRERRCKILQRLGAMLEAKDAYTLGHSRRVTRHAERIARELGLSRADVARVRIAASVHDIGKVHTPRQILTKPGSLTAEELAVMKRHPVDGARMVAELGDPEITAMVRHHHERLDGSGYPAGLHAAEIPLGARIISVADTFDAVTSSRTYHGTRKHRRALDVISEEAGRRLDPDVVAAFLRYYSGRRVAAWSAFGLTGPPRLVTWSTGLLGGVGGPPPHLAQSFAAIVAAALAGASLGGPPATASESASARAGGSEPDRAARGGSDRNAGGRSEAAPTDRRGPVDDRPGSRPQRDAPGGGGQGPASPRETGGTAPEEPARAPPRPVEEPDVPPVDPPLVELPAVEVPGVDLPPVELPEIHVPAIEEPSIEAPTLELPKPQLHTEARD